LAKHLRRSAGQKLAYVYFEEEPGAESGAILVCSSSLILLGIGTHSGKIRLPLSRYDYPPITDRANALENDAVITDWKASMKKKPVTTVVVLTLTMLLLAPLEASAGGRGGGVGVGGNGFGFGRNFLARQHFRSFQNNFGLWPLYGYGALYTYDDDDSTDYQMPQTVVRPVPPHFTCQHSEQTYTVPSENGGTRQVTILRC
jgi:hypothetical protein